MLDLVSTKVTAVHGGYLLRTTVLPGEDRPYALKGQRYTGGAYVRDGSATVTATEEEIRDMIRESAPEPWESRLSRRTDLTFEEAADVFRKYKVEFSPVHHRELGLADENGYFTRLGELLSDQNQTRLVIGTFSRDTVSLSLRRLSGSLLRQLDRAFDLFAESNPEIFHKTDGLANRHYFAWPPKALREALVNCAVHRDYAEPEPTKVSVFPNRFEFLSYGSIPGRLSVKDIVLEGVSKCRNEHLADILRRLGWMENYGSGFPMIWREYANSGVEPKLEATRRVVRIILPRIHDDSRSALKERCRIVRKSRHARHGGCDESVERLENFSQLRRQRSAQRRTDPKDRQRTNDPVPVAVAITSAQTAYVAICGLKKQNNAEAQSPPAGGARCFGVLRHSVPRRTSFRTALRASPRAALRSSVGTAVRSAAGAGSTRTALRTVTVRFRRLRRRGTRRFRRLGRTGRLRRTRLRAVGEESAVLVHRIAATVVPPVMTVPTAFAIVLADVVAGERIGDAAQDVAQKFVGSVGARGGKTQ